MVIYGVGLLAFCYLTGMYIGDVLGALLGVKANIGGLGRNVHSYRCSDELYPKRGSSRLRRHRGFLGRSLGLCSGLPADPRAQLVR